MELTILLTVLIGIVYFWGLSAGVVDVPFTATWKVKRKAEAQQIFVQSYVKHCETFYFICEADYYIVANALKDAVNAVSGSDGILRVEKIRSILPSEYIHRVNKRDGTIFFSFLINIANPGGSIRDGKLVTNKVDFQRIASKINAHLLTFLEGTGYSYQNITVYMDEKGIYYLRLEGLRYVVPNMNGGKLVI